MGREFAACTKDPIIRSTARPRRHDDADAPDDVLLRAAFRLKGVDHVLPPGSYDVVTEEELIAELSFPVYRRVSTMIFVPAQSEDANLQDKEEPPCPS